MQSTKLKSQSDVQMAGHASQLRNAAMVFAWKMIQRWKSSIGFALLDQAMMSFANFVPLIIAARVLPIDEFGEYSIIWAISLLVVSAATALIVDPLPAIVSTRPSTVLKPILGVAAGLALLAGGGLAGLILISGLIVWAWSPSLGLLLLFLAIVVPFQQMQFACRRFCYLMRRQGVAAASAGAYATVLIGGVF